MKRRVICLCCAVVVINAPDAWAAGKGFDLGRLRAQTQAAMRTETDIPFKKEELHALIREVAAKIEEKYQGKRPEADGLVQRVEEMLAAPEPAPQADENDRPRMLANQMEVMNGEFDFHFVVSGVRGPVFDSSGTGYMQRYQDLEAASARDAEEVWRWLEMEEAARKCGWKDKAETASQRALGAARALVSREPKNAEAHALLGMALAWSSEKLAELQTALKLDPRQALALHEMLQRRANLALENAAQGRETTLEQSMLSDEALAQALYERPPTDENIAACEHETQELSLELERLLSLSEQQGNMVIYLKTAYSLSRLGFYREALVAAARRDPQEPHEVFLARLKVMMLNTSFKVFADDAVLKTALKLAGDDPEARSTIILMAMIGDTMKLAREQQRPQEPRMVLLRETFTWLLEKAESGESLQAAHASEGVFLMEMAMVMLLQREPLHPELLLRAVRLEPFHQRTQELLTGMCLAANRKSHVLTAGAALAMTELALLPGQRTRLIYAIAAAKMHDWPAAHRCLDTCLKEKPDDLGVLNQKAVTYLRESQSDTAQRKAQFYFHKIETLRGKPGAQPGKEGIKLIVRNHILFLMLGGKNAAAREELARARKDKTLEEKECDELEKLLP